MRLGEDRPGCGGEIEGWAEDGFVKLGGVCDVADAATGAAIFPILTLCAGYQRVLATDPVRCSDGFSFLD